jgi:ferric-dicitrate binding protein FerR (iron transport regulator)
METNSTYYIDLITRYFFGEATPEEMCELEAWVKADPANARTFSEYQKTWKAISQEKIESSTNLDQEWNTLKTKIAAQNQKQLFIPEAGKASKSEIRNLNSEIRNPQSEILSWSLRVAAVFLLLAIPSFFLYRYFNTASDNLLTATDGVIEQTLPDGTIVTLNSGSTLSYPSHFDGSLRKVTLQGEAWFEVARNKNKPFIIASGNVRIRVVGTTFFVNTNTGDDTKEVILSTGMVKVYYDNKPEMSAFLSPGEKAELNANDYVIVKTTNEDVNFLAWKTKHLIFNNTPLNEVVHLLTKVYHTNITLSGDPLNDCRITATFDRQSLESILNVLKATLDLQVRNNSTGIELSGQGCNQGK